MSAPISEDRTRELILEGIASSQNITKIEEVVKPKVDSIEERLRVMEAQMNTYLKQVESEVQKAKDIASNAATEVDKSVKEVKAHVTFLDEKRTEIVEENERIKKAVGTINEKSTAIETAQRAMVDEFQKEIAKNRVNIAETQVKAEAGVREAGNILWARIEEAKKETMQMADATAAAAAAGRGTTGGA